MEGNIKEKVLFGIGFAFLVVGVFIFLPIVKVTLDQWGKFNVSKNLYFFRMTIGGVGAFLIGWGIITIWFRAREGILNINLVLVSCFVFGPLIMEVILRTGIEVLPGVFRSPGLYSSVFDEDYFKLRTLWGLDKQSVISKEDSVETDDSLSKLGYDSVLGWAYQKTPENPLGVLTDSSYVIEKNGKNILFFGDSFVQKGKNMSDKIPQLLDTHLQEYAVYNYGVGGYGLDQIFLRFKRSHGEFNNPFIIVGILTGDIDRCLLKYRNRPKPYFLLQNNQLELFGVPVSSDKHSWLKEHPVSIKSYAASSIIRVFQYLKAGGVTEQSVYRQDEKKRIGSKLIEGIVKEARENQLRLLFVVFVDSVGGGWRKAFLLEEIERWGIPYVDTEDELLQAMDGNESFPKLYYDETDNHHNTLANSIIAKAIERSLKKVLRSHESLTRPQ